MSDRVVVAVIDSGIDLSDEYFFDKSDRFEGFYDINSNRFFGSYDEAFDSKLFYDSSYHGTKVSKIVLENSTNSFLLIIRLKPEYRNSVTLTTSLMLGIDYAIRYSIQNDTPIVINISYGMEYGSHNGDSILEEYINSVSRISKCIFVVGTGNEGDTKKHMSLYLNRSAINCPFFVSELSYYFNACIYYKGFDEIEVSLKSPNNQIVNLRSGLTEFADTYKLISYKTSSDIFSLYNEVFIACYGEGGYLPYGIWDIILTPLDIVDGNVEIWLPDNSYTTSDISFLYPNSNKTLTIPSTTTNVISVGAYDPKTFSVMPFSGRGYNLSDEVKPDVCASGVDGTSFAAPRVSAICAEEMYKGIVLGEDLFLYGEKLKVKIIDRAFRIGGIVYPNNISGWGYL